MDVPVRELVLLAVSEDVELADALNVGEIEDVADDEADAEPLTVTEDETLGEGDTTLVEGEAVALGDTTDAEGDAVPEGVIETEAEAVGEVEGTTAMHEPAVAVLFDEAQAQAVQVPPAPVSAPGAQQQPPKHVADSEHSALVTHASPTGRATHTPEPGVQ